MRTSIIHTYFYIVCNLLCNAHPPTTCAPAEHHRHGRAHDEPRREAALMAWSPMARLTPPLRRSIKRKTKVDSYSTDVTADTVVCRASSRRNAVASDDLPLSPRFAYVARFRPGALDALIAKTPKPERSRHRNRVAKPFSERSYTVFA